MSNAELASKAGSMQAFVRKLTDAVELVEAAHGLDGSIGAAKQELARVQEEAAKAKAEAEAEKAEIKSELEADRAKLKQAKDNLANAHQEAEAIVSDAAKRGADLIDQARAAAKGEADAIRATIADLGRQEVEARAAKEAANIQAREAHQEAMNARAALESLKKQAKALAGV